MTDESAEVGRLVMSAPWLVAVLEAVRDVAPPDWYVAAGAVRNTVWDVLSGRPSHGPHGDIDVVYFDAAGARDETYANQLAARLPDHECELTNQALVHLWQSRRLGRDVPPYSSVAAAIAAWPETATAVGVTLNARGELSVLAPLGLRDLMSLTVRPNPRRIDRAAYRERLQQKSWQHRWPSLTVIAPDDD